MAIKSKFLSDAAWKDVAAKNKIKDNGLQKALEKLRRVDGDDHDEQTKILDEVVKLVALLKKDKAVMGASAVARHLAEMQGDAESAAREAAKARAEHEKVQKARVEAEKKAAAKQDDGDEDDEVESPEMLTSKLKPLLKLVAKGETMHALLAKSGKQVKVLLSRKPIPPARRKMLAEQLGGGSAKFYPGVCGLEAGATTFALKAEVAGMSKLVKAALLEQTGLRLNKLKCRGEDGDDEDDDDDQPAAGKNGAPQVKAQPKPQAAAQAVPDVAAAAEQVLGGATAFASPGDYAQPVTADSGVALPQMAAVDMPDESIAADIMDKQLKILDSWKSALKIFFTTMISSADAEAKPDYQKAMASYVSDKLIGEMVKRAPGMSEISAAAKAMEGEYKRAAAAKASATLRDFVNQQERAVDNAGRALVAQQNAFIAAVQAVRVAAEKYEPAAAKSGKRGGTVEVNPPQLEQWSMLRMKLMDMLDAVDKVFAESSPEKLMKVLSEAWISQGTKYAGMGLRVPAAIIIRLNPDYSVKNAHIEGSGGQKLAEELLKEFPDGVDVFGFKTRRRIVHYADNGWPQTTLELDANDRDLSRGAMIEGDTRGLYKYVMSRRLPPTKKLTGD